MPTFDTLISGGTVVDGTGAAPYTADIAISDGRIAAIGRDLGQAKANVNADGLTITPGWVDIHTHYDGQVTWDPILHQTLFHGVTTLVMGNCGVGFAPAVPDQHQWLIGLMEGVEDIPGEALNAGMKWEWETFPEYMNALDAVPRTLDIGAQIGHGALRAYVMDQRGADNEVATAADIERMAALTGEAIRAGALGFSTSRTMVHIAVDGRPVPGTFASEDELLAIARAVKATGRGLVEIVTAGVAGEDPAALDREMGMVRRIAEGSQCPTMFLLAQHNSDGEQWRRQLAMCDAAARDAVPVIPQVAARPVSILFCFEGEHPWRYMPSYQSIKDLPFAERLAKLRDPAMRAQLLSEQDPNDTGFSMLYKSPILWDMTYLAGDPINYTPPPDSCIARIAAREGRSPWAVAYDRLLEQDGRAFLMHTVTNYFDANPLAVREMLRHPQAVLGLSDAGAHVRFVCDSGMHTYMLTNWVRELDERNPLHLPLEFVVKKLTADNARLYGMSDRGVLAAGRRADLNLIDLPRLRTAAPRMVYDLPAGLPRLREQVTGYVGTYVKGELVQQAGELTGARPGRVVRSR